MPTLLTLLCVVVYEDSGDTPYIERRYVHPGSQTVEREKRKCHAAYANLDLTAVYLADRGKITQLLGGSGFAVGRSEPFCLSRWIFLCVWCTNRPTRAAGTPTLPGLSNLMLFCVAESSQSA